MTARYHRINEAYDAALAGRDPEAISILQLIPAIFDAVPDATLEEIADSLEWRADRLQGKA